MRARNILSVVLVLGPVVVLIAQQLTGFIPIVQSSDATWITVICAVSIAAGFGAIGSTPRTQYRNFMLALGLVLGLPLLVGTLGLVSDAALGTEFAPHGIITPLNTIGSQVGDWVVITQLVTGLIPAGVIVVGIVMIYMSDGPDEYATAIAETLLAVGILVLATFAFDWLGVNLW